MYYFTSYVVLKSLQITRNHSMQMMKVSEEDLKEFSRQRFVVEVNSEEDDRERQQMFDEYIKAEKMLEQAREKLGQHPSQ